jgi:16S rRNA (adenine1518-N6/adenine1519-N6)-dimethyltransferase
VKPIHVKAKKFLGQHFLKDENIAARIASVPMQDSFKGPLLEVGPGMGVLTKYIMGTHQIKVCEIDRESVAYLNQVYPELYIYEADFLKMPLDGIFEEPFGVVGNFPYNISSQIVFKVVENRKYIPYLSGMFQREMARRIASPPGSGEYGIISVLTQAWYDVTYHFTVNEGVFNPPPKVKSGVISMTLRTQPGIDNEKHFRELVKTAFNQRRKTLRNTLRGMINNPGILAEPLFDRRPETLAVSEFINLSNRIYGLSQPGS